MYIPLAWPLIPVLQRTEKNYMQLHEMRMDFTYSFSLSVVASLNN